LFEAINQACKKMKIKQIDLESLDEAIPWYLSKGFVRNFSKKDEGLTQLTKRVSWSSRTPFSSPIKYPASKTVRKTVVRKRKRKTERKKVRKTPRKKPRNKGNQDK